MNRTRENLIRLHSDITAYAASKLSDYGLPRCDLGDIVSEAYLKAQRKLPRHTPRKSRKELFKAIAWSEVMDELRKRNTIRCLHEKYDLRLDAPKRTDESDGSDDEPESDGIVISDNGVSAATIRHFDDPDKELEWKRETRERYAKTHNGPRKVLDGLKTTWDYETLRRKLGYKKPYFYLLIKNLRIRFDQCFRAYHAWLAEKALRVD